MHAKLKKPNGSLYTFFERFLLKAPLFTTICSGNNRVISFKLLFQRKEKTRSEEQKNNGQPSWNKLVFQSARLSEQDCVGAYYSGDQTKSTYRAIRQARKRGEERR